MIALALMTMLISAEGGQRWVVTPPERILVVVRAPPALEGISTSEILESAAESIATAAHAAVLSSEQVGLAAAEFDACPLEVRSSCWVELALRAGQPALAALVLVSLQPSGAGHQITIVSFDLKRAREELEGSDRDAVEQTIWDRAVRSPAERVAPGELRAFMGRRIDAELGELLRAIAPKDELGAVDLTNAAPGTDVSLDGANLGVIASSRARIDAVGAGSHQLRWASGGAIVERQIEVRAGDAIELDLAIAPEPFPLRTVVLAAGGAMFVTGAALAIAELTKDQGAAICFHRGAPADCDGGAPTFEPGLGGVAAPGSDRGARALLVVGLGLGVAGATWGIGALLLDDVSSWWAVAAGFVLGAATSAVAVVLDR